jgi:hypothetical protein
VLISVTLSDFECGERDGGECGGEEPKPHDDLGLAPANKVEVMVDGSTSEESFSDGVLEVTDLQDHACKFDNKYTSYY